MANEQQQIKKLLEGLHNAIQSLNSNSKESMRINRELLKTMALLQSGFAQNEEDARSLIEDVREGLELTDEYAKKWAKQRGATQKDLDDLLDKFRELEELQEDQIDNAKDYLDLLDGQNDLFTDGLNISKQLLDNHSALTKVIRDSKNVAQRLSGVTGNIDSVLTNIVRKKVDFGSMFSDVLPFVQDAEVLIGKIQEDFNGLINNLSGSEFDLPLNFTLTGNELDTEIKKIHDGIEQEKDLRIASLDEFFAKNKKLQTQLSRQIASQLSGLDIQIDIDTGNIMTSSGILKKGMKEYEDWVNKLDEIVKGNSITEQLQLDFKEIGELIRLGSDATDDQKVRLNQLLQPMDLATKLLIEQVQLRQDDLDTLKAGVSLERDRLKALSKYSNYLSSAENVVMKIGSGFDYINSVLPSGVGNFLGLDDVSLKLLEGHKRGVEAFATALSNGANQGEAIQGYLSSFGPTLRLAINPLTAIVAGILLLKEFVEGIVEKYKQMSQEMNISLIQSKKLLDVQLDILTSSKNQFATIQDITDAQKAMIGDSGKVFDLMNKGQQQSAINLVEIGKAFGYGTENAVKLQKTFERLGASDKLSEQLQRSVGFMSEAAGLSPQIVAQDLIDSSEEVSIYFSGLPEKAAKAAIEVRRLGLSLKQAGSIAQKMLNLEGFMTDMYELMAMSGQGIDFSGAFEKGLVGDIKGMTEEIMNQVGTTAEFNKMDYLTRMKMAKTLGMSVDELAKSVMLHEKMQGLDAKDAKYLDANLDRMGDITDLSQDEIKNRLSQLQSTDRLAIAWDKIKGVIVKTFLPVVEIFANTLEAISPFLDQILIPAFEGLLVPIKGLLQLIKLISPILKPVFQLMTGFASIIGSVVEKFTGVKSELTDIGELVKWVTAGFTTWFIGKKALGFLSSAKDETKSLGSSIPGIGNLFSSLFGKASSDSIATSKQIVNTTQTATQQIQQEAKVASSTIVSVNNSAASAVVDTSKKIDNQKLDSIVTNTKAATDQVKSDLNTVAIKADEVSKRVNKSSNGFFSGISGKGISKTIFSTLTKASAATFSLMAADMVRGFMQGEEAGKSAMDTVKDHGMTMFGGLAVSGVGMLSSYLEEGLIKAFEKMTFKSFEEKLDPIMKKARKGVESLGPAASKSLSPIGSLFSKIGDNIRTLVPSAAEGKGLLGKIFGKKQEIIDQVNTVTDATQTLNESTKKVKTKDLVETATKTINENVIEKPKPDLIEKSLPDLTSTETKVKKQTKSITDIVKDGFSGLETLLKKAWEGIKTVILDISKVASQVLQNIGQGIGQTIKSILKGIGDGLSSFKTSALKGAATLLVLSSALWVSSKALSNFANVKWEDIGKATVTLAGLSAIAMLLGSSSAQMILGAVAIGLLGASLIPAAYALKMFSDVKWESIGKAATMLLTLGIAGAALGSFAPLMLLGSLAIAALGVSLIPTAFALQMFEKINWSSIAKGATALLAFGGIAALFGTFTPILLLGSVAIGVLSASIGLFSVSLYALGTAIQVISKPLESIPNNLDRIAQSLNNLLAIDASNLFTISAGIISISAALTALSLSQIGTGIFDKLFGNDIVSKLEKIGEQSTAIQIVSDSVQNLVSGLLKLTEIITNLDFSELENFKNISVDIQQNVLKKEDIQKPIKPEIKTLPPKKEVVAQDLQIKPILPQFDVQQNKDVEEDMYKQELDVESNGTLSEIKQLMKQMNQLLMIIAQKDPTIQLDGYSFNQTLKKYNN